MTMDDESQERWIPGIAPIAVVMISLNESHNIDDVCESLRGWAQEVFLIDSYSQDQTVEKAMKQGVRVIQRAFTDFGDQWNYALKSLPISAPWTMKLDPDERLTEELKRNILTEVRRERCSGIQFRRRWWLMNTQLPICDTVLRIWRTGACQFTSVKVNEHPIVTGQIVTVDGLLEHLDSPNLTHWINKQNKYSHEEAKRYFYNLQLADTPNLLGNALQRKMWIKKYFLHVPFRYSLLFFYFWMWKGLWKKGWVGYACAKLWVHSFFIIECKYREMKLAASVKQKSPNFDTKIT